MKTISNFLILLLLLATACAPMTIKIDKIEGTIIPPDPKTAQAQCKKGELFGCIFEYQSLQKVVPNETPAQKEAREAHAAQIMAKVCSMKGVTCTSSK